MQATEKNHEHAALLFFKSIITSTLILTLSLLAGMYLVDHRSPLHSPSMTAVFVLVLAGADFIAVLCLEPYRRYLSRMTMPALIGVMTIVILFVLAGSLNRFFEHLDFDFLVPLSVASLGLIYATIFLERNIAMKFYLCINSIAVMMIWALASINKVTVPF